MHSAVFPTPDSVWKVGWNIFAYIAVSYSTTRIVKLEFQFKENQTESLIIFFVIRAALNMLFKILTSDTVL